MGYPAREPLDVKMFFYHRGTWVISKLGFRNYLQWSYPKQYIRVDHVELTITSNKKSLCKQCLFLKSNLKSLSRWLTLQRFLKCLLITLHLLLAPNKRQLSFFLYFSFPHAHISSLGFHPAPVQLFYFTIVVILRLQSWSCLSATFCSLTLSSIIGTKGLISLNLCCALVLFTLRFVAPEQKLFYGQFFATWLCWACNWNQGLQFAKFFHALVLFTMCFVAPEQMLFCQFLFPDSVERVFEPGA